MNINFFFFFFFFASDHLFSGVLYCWLTFLIPFASWPLKTSSHSFQNGGCKSKDRKYSPQEKYCGEKSPETAGDPKLKWTGPSENQIEDGSKKYAITGPNSF